MTKKILILTGEASGDLHAANLVRKIQQLDSTTQFVGMGGQKMREAGVEIIQDINQLSVIGLTEIFARLPFLYSVYKKIKQLIETKHYDLIILVDCPGFNLRFAKIAKKAQQKVLYYISPQLWAWHQSRVELIRKNIDTMAVVFPFEVNFYKRFGINAHFVGHPLTEIVKALQTADQIKKKFDLSATIIIGLMPGSRRGEIKRILPIMIKTAELIQKKYPKAQFLMPLASSLTSNDLQPYLNNSVAIKITRGDTYDVINSCDALMVTSGTATLETTLLNKPFAIIYKTSWLTYLIGRIVVKVKYLGLCNLLSNKIIVKEFLQYNAKPQLIAEEIIKIIDDNTYRNNIISELEKIKDSLKAENAENLAELVFNELNVALMERSDNSVMPAEIGVVIASEAKQSRFL